MSCITLVENLSNIKTTMPAHIGRLYIFLYTKPNLRIVQKYKSLQIYHIDIAVYTTRHDMR